MDHRLPPREEVRREDGLDKRDRMRDSILSAIRKQKRGYLRIRGVVSSGRVKLEEVEYGESAEEEERSPKMAAMIRKLRCEEKPYYSSVAQEEGTQPNAGKRAASTRKVLWWDMICGLDLHTRSLSCAYTSIELWSPLALLCWAVYRK